MRRSYRFSWLIFVYGVVLAVAGFTGFGNMPLYGRYYIADLPGLAWSGDFFLNLHVHYLSGAVLVTLSVYFSIQFWTMQHRKLRLTASGYFRVVTLGIVLLSGVVMALKNLPHTIIPFPWVAVLTLGHMVFAVVALVVYFYCTFKHRKFYQEM